jgi:hypothetical protein
MYQMISVCPVCDEKLAVRRLHCRNCDTSLEGHFELGWLGRLSPEQLDYVETFVRCEGKLNRMERELGLSYPTLRSRLWDVIRALGYEIGSEEPDMSDEERHKVLDELSSGKITSDEALAMLESDGGG